MEFLVTGRNFSISDRFRDYVEEKISKIEQLAGRAQRVEAKTTQQAKVRDPQTQFTVELTLVGKGPVIRSEAKGSDQFAAFDSAYTKFLERVRRAKDKRKIHRGRHTPMAVWEATADVPQSLVERTDPIGQKGAAVKEAAEPDMEVSSPELAEQSPVLIRRKSFPAEVISVDDAIDNMELVGHDFYLFVDAETDAPSVVYRRQGWTYGVITLDAPNADGDDGVEELRGYREGQRVLS